MKSHVSDLLDLVSCVYYDAATKCAVPPDNRDLKRIRSRVEHEGLSFLTITLPSLGADFERSMAEGMIGPTSFRSFGKLGKIPAFLQGFFVHVFDKGTGRILDEPDAAHVEGIRQMAYTFKKLSMDCGPMRTAKSITGFVECESDLSRPLPEDLQDKYLKVVDVLWGDMMRPLDVFTFIPKHGPGATVEKLSGNQKFRYRSWHDRLEPYFPLLATAFTSVLAVESEEFERISVVTEEQEPPVRVVTVPKTLKGPRVIAIEPVCMQFTQQAVSRALVSVLETSRYTAGHVNFRNQQINRQMALTASRTLEWATLDLSSASDRVPFDLAISMFRSNAALCGAIEACRSRRAQLPSGEILTLRKFASMGSALCFPVESMYFYTLCVGALLEKRNLPVTPRTVYNVSRDVYVYGDDIIVPADDAAAVAVHLQKYFCKVNMSKSFWTGRFRESCGMDAFDGYEVTPTYVRQLPPSNRRNAKELISWVAASNHFYQCGYWKTAQHMVHVCERILGKLPILSGSASGLGKVSFQRYVSTERWNRRYHRPEVRAWVASPVRHRDELDGYGALAKCILRLERSPDSSDLEAQDTQHLARSARHGAVTLKRRWTCPLSWGQGG